MRATITLTNEAIDYINYQETLRKHEAKAKRELIKIRVAELVAAGVDKDMARTLARVEYEYNL